MKNYKYCIFIGKFSPFHNAHKAIIDNALKQAETIIIVIGSSCTSRTLRNPWSEQERKDMIENSFSDEEKKRFNFVFMKDYLYNDNFWTLTLQQKISEITDYANDKEIALISFEEDKSSYIKSFPQYSNIKFKYDEPHHAHDLRNRYFTYDISYQNHLPISVSKNLSEFQKTEAFISLKEEFDYVRKYKAAWDGAPFPPFFMTVDGVILKSGHILLIRRKFNPGKGLLALPGGFVNQNEKLREAVIREIKEETKIGINYHDLNKSIISSQIFDEPLRSARGRVITQAYLIDLGVGDLPKIKGSDDAERAIWLPLNEIFSKENEFFEDHYHIICNFLYKF